MCYGAVLSGKLGMIRLWYGWLGEMENPKQIRVYHVRYSSWNFGWKFPPVFGDILSFKILREVWQVVQTSCDVKVVSLTSLASSKCRAERLGFSTAQGNYISTVKYRTHLLGGTAMTSFQTASRKRLPGNNVLLFIDTWSLSSSIFQKQEGISMTKSRLAFLCIIYFTCHRWGSENMFKLFYFTILPPRII